jgi:hypothetical protein
MGKMIVVTKLGTIESIDSSEKDLKGIESFLEENINKLSFFSVETENGPVIIAGDLMKQSFVRIVK